LDLLDNPQDCNPATTFSQQGVAESVDAFLASCQAALQHHCCLCIKNKLLAPTIAMRPSATMLYTTLPTYDAMLPLPLSLISPRKLPTCRHNQICGVTTANGNLLSRMSSQMITVSEGHVQKAIVAAAVLEQQHRVCLLKPNHWPAIMAVQATLTACALHLCRAQQLVSRLHDASLGGLHLHKACITPCTNTSGSQHSPQQRWSTQ
jgi:hypothetical protein